MICPSERANFPVPAASVKRFLSSELRLGSSATSKRANGTLLTVSESVSASRQGAQLWFMQRQIQLQANMTISWLEEGHLAASWPTD